jgi:SAM-dependent methyltransferase
VRERKKQQGKRKKVCLWTLCAVLDIGIGTGTSLCANASLVQSKALSVVGVDIDEVYVRHCEGALRAAELHSSRVVCKSVLDADLADVVGKEFDAVYFSGSIALIPTPHKVGKEKGDEERELFFSLTELQALQVAASLLRRGGVVYVTQTFQRKSFPLLGVIKPLLSNPKMSFDANKFGRY